MSVTTSPDASFARRVADVLIASGVTTRVSVQWAAGGGYTVAAAVKRHRCEVIITDQVAAMWCSPTALADNMVARLLRMADGVVG